MVLRPGPDPRRPALPVASHVEHLDPLLADPPGTEMDDLAGVDGCWGSALLADNPNVAAIYFVLQLDPAGERYEEWILTDALGVVLVWHSVGPLKLGPGARLTMTRERSQAFGPPQDFTGQADVMVNDFMWSELEDDGRVLEFLGTLSGDRLRLHYGDANREPTDPGDDNVYVRFECPSQ